MNKQPGSGNAHFSMNNFKVRSVSSAIPVWIMKGLPFRIHPDPQYLCENVWVAILDKQWYLVDQDFAESAEFVPGMSKKRADLYTGIRTDGSLFVFPVTYPDTQDALSWRKTLLPLIEAAKKQWIVISVDSNEKIFTGTPVLMPRPILPNVTPAKVFAEAFRNRIIDEKFAHTYRQRRAKKSHRVIDEEIDE